MSILDSLRNVAVFKIHPALGVARLANNDDFYEFFESEAKRSIGENCSLKYMSMQRNSYMDKDRHAVKRQAVQFKIFAYDKNGNELGELSEEAMSRLGITPTWTVNIANRKLYFRSGKSTNVVSASGSASPGQQIRLEGSNPWRDSKVWLGDLTGSGLFIPPKGGVYRKPSSIDSETSDKEIPRHAKYQKDNGVQDTTSDGSIDVFLSGTRDIPVIPAAVLVAPQQHSPDVNPANVQDESHNKDFTSATRDLLEIPEDAKLDGEGYDMDRAMMKTINADYNPGMEICISPEASKDQYLERPEKAFYPPGEDHIARAEIRPRYEDGVVDHGALTAGLCSAWQSDLTECLNYWTAEYPPEVYFSRSDEDGYPLSRKEFKSSSYMAEPEDLNAYIDNMDIARNIDHNIERLRSTERDANDNMGDTPKAPFPVDPPQ